MLDNIMTKEDLNDYNDELLSYVNAKLNKINDNIDTYHTESGNPITIKDAADVNAVDVSVNIEPIQDLHGYDHPWVGGAGKNKLPMTVDGIKSANTSGTWSGNAYTYNGVTFTIQTDNDSNVTGINADGTASSIAFFNVGVYTASAGDILNGCPAGGGNNGPYKIMGIGATTSDTGDGIVIVNEVGQEATYRIVVWSNVTVTNLKFYPMIRKSTEIDASFEPYTNICRIRPVTEFDMSGIFNINDSSVVFGTAMYYTYTLKPNTNYTLSTNYPGRADNQDDLFAGANGFEYPGIRQGSPRTITTGSNGQLHIYVRFDSSYYDLYNAVKQGVYCIRLEEGSIANEPSPQIEIQRVGKNLFDKDSVTMSVYLKTDGSVVESQTWDISDYIPVVENEKITKSGTVEIGTNPSSCFYDENKNYISGIRISSTAQTLTVPSGARYFRTTVAKAEKSALMIERGDTATTYEPYQGETYIIKTGSNVYGGTLDATTGKLVITPGYVDLGDMTWAKDNNGVFYTTNIRDLINKQTSNVICSAYPYIGYGLNQNVMTDKTVFLRTDGLIFIKDTSYTDTSALKTAVTGQQLVYELATTQTINLTPQQIKLLKGTNTLYANSKDIEVSYWKGNVIGDIIKVLESKLDNMKDEIMTYLDSQIINGGS